MLSTPSMWLSPTPPRPDFRDLRERHAAKRRVHHRSSRHWKVLWGSASVSRWRRWNAFAAGDVGPKSRGRCSRARWHGFVLEVHTPDPVIRAFHLIRDERSGGRRDGPADGTSRSARRGAHSTAGSSACAADDGLLCRIVEIEVVGLAHWASSRSLGLDLLSGE